MSMARFLTMRRLNLNTTLRDGTSMISNSGQSLFKCQLMHWIEA